MEALRRKTADHFHGNVAASFWPGDCSLAGTGPSGTCRRSAPALSPPRRGCQMDAGARRCQRRGSRPAEAGTAHRGGGCARAGGNLCCRRGAGGGGGLRGGKQEGSGQDALSDSSPCAREAVNSPRAGSAVPAEMLSLCLPCALGCWGGGDRLRGQGDERPWWHRECSELRGDNPVGFPARAGCNGRAPGRGAGSLRRWEPGLKGQII